MRDKIEITKTKTGFTMARTLEEQITPEQMEERIQKMEADLEAYTDTFNHLTENREAILKEQSDKLDKDAKEYGKAIENLKANIQALKDASVLGKGTAESKKEDEPEQGTVQ